MMKTAGTGGRPGKRQARAKESRVLAKGCAGSAPGDAGDASVRQSSYKGVREHSPRKAYAAEISFSRETGSKNTRTLIAFIKRGLSMSSFYELSSELEVQPARLMTVLNIAPRTMVRRKKEGRLEKDESERLYRVGRLFARAVQALGSKEAARTWMKTPKKALGNEVPLEYADTEIGAREIDDLLGRLEHGVFS